jgi:hypothetical protein
LACEADASQFESGRSPHFKEVLMPLDVYDHHFLRQELDHIKTQITREIRERFRDLKEILMTNFADLDAAIAVEAKDLADLQRGLKDNADVIAALQNKIAAGQDVSAEVAALQKNNDAFAKAIASLAVTDTGVDINSMQPQPQPAAPPAPASTTPDVTPPSADATSAQAGVASSQDSGTPFLAESEKPATNT